MLREGYRCSCIGQGGYGRGEVFESGPLTQELETPAVVWGEPDARGRKETADVDGDALELAILETRSSIRRRENPVERLSAKARGRLSAAWRGRGIPGEVERTRQVGAAGPPGQKDLPGREDEISDCTGRPVEIDPWDHHDDALLVHGASPFREFDAVSLPHTS